MPIKAITCRFEESLYTDISRIADDKNQSLNSCISQAIQMYCERYYAQEKLSTITDEFIRATEAQLKLWEHRINNRSNQLLSSLAIQQFILCKVLAESFEISPDALEFSRKQAAECMKENNRIFSWGEMIE